MTDEEFYKKIVYFNSRIDNCESICILRDIEDEWHWWKLTFLIHPELYKMQIIHNDDFKAIRMRITEKYAELRKENGYEEIED